MDVIVVKVNLLDNVGVLIDVVNVIYVWRGGKLFKSLV